MKGYIAVLEIDDDEEIIDASVAYVYRSNGTNYSTTESVNLKEESEWLSKKTYEDGLNDVWECAKKLLKGEYDQYKRFEIFGNTDVDNIFTLLTGAEALAKLKKYEEEQEQKEAAEIKIGDEVTDNDGWNGVVTWVSPDGEYMVVTLQDGSALRLKKEHFKKTGRHFSQIEEVLKQMQEGNE